MHRIAPPFLPLAVFALLMPGMVQAAPANSASFSGTAEAVLVEPSAIVEIDELRFGQFWQPTANGNLILQPGGAFSASGGMVGLANPPQVGTGRGPARFQINGDPNRQFTVNLPPFINIANGAATMRVFQFRTNVPNPRGRLSATGHFDLYVGARLQVQANQAFGTYRGSYTVTVAYQ